MAEQLDIYIPNQHSNAIPVIAKLPTKGHKPKNLPKPRKPSDVKVIPNPDAPERPTPRKLDEDVILNKAEILRAKRNQHTREYQHRKLQEARDIYPIPWEEINWDRRLSTKEDPALFFKTYLGNMFPLGWSDDHLLFHERLKRVMMDVGIKQALAMPRGGGKTTNCTGGIVWGTAHAWKTFPVFIGSKDPAAQATLSAVKTLWYRSPMLRQDFPEIGYPIFRIENRFHLAKGQLYRGENTGIEWGTSEIWYPSLLLGDEEAQIFEKNDPTSINWIEELQRHSPASAGCIIQTAGIDGSIRGRVELNPVTLKQMRPDVVLLDDVQKDQKAESPTSCEKMIILIDGAVEGLSGPEGKISGLMPCTVIRRGDVSDTYLDKTVKPEWNGIRTKMVTRWPEGMTDFEITTETETSRKWIEYDEVRRTSLRLRGDISLATEFYEQHREILDEDFSVSWEERYVKDGTNREASAIQSAMNLRLTNPRTFPSEYQNVGRMDEINTDAMITADQFAEKQLPVKEFEVPGDTRHIACFIDVQDEMLFITTMACSQDFTGVVPYYGTFPHIDSRMFTKSQTLGWNMLSTLFFTAYPQYRSKAVKTASGKIRAPLDEKIYHGVKEAIRYCQSLTFITQDGFSTERRAGKIAVDARWGATADAVKRAVNDFRSPDIISYLGASIPPTNKQLEEYTRSGQYNRWLFEDQIHPNIENVKWVIKLGEDGIPYFFADVDRLKDFLFARLGTSPGGRGSISLYQVPSPDFHAMFANQVCNSEYPTLVEANTIKKNKWMMREGTRDNEYLDGCTGCVALLSWMGAFKPLSLTDKPPIKITRKLSDMYKKKRQWPR